MSGIGFWELIILSLIGLVILGPERLPRVANQLGSWLGQARRMTRVMKRQLEEELNLERQFGIEPPAQSRPAHQGSYRPPTPPQGDRPPEPPDTGSVQTPNADAEPPAAGDDGEGAAAGADEPRPASQPGRSRQDS